MPNFIGLGTGLDRILLALYNIFSLNVHQKRDFTIYYHITIISTSLLPRQRELYKLVPFIVTKCHSCPIHEI